MNPTDLTTRLETALQKISTLLTRLSANDWQRPQGEKWLIAEEFEHLRLSTQATAFILGTAGRARWQPHAGRSRSFDEIVAEYQAGLRASPGAVNAATRPADDARTIKIADQQASWSLITPMISKDVAELSESELDTSTVWKHPLLGPLTVREMILFTIYHTEHHLRSMIRKQGRAAAGQ